MEFELSILSTEEDYAAVRHAVIAFLDTYGNCEVKLYEEGKTIAEDGMTIHGEYGTLDALFVPLKDSRLSFSENFDEGRLWLEWNLVLHPSEDI
jgi:hypothetical protein